MSKFYLVLAVCLVLGASQISAEFWDDFRVTYNVNAFGHFNRLPKTLNTSDSNTWELVSTDCSNDGKFNGFQYIVPGDVSAALLFDVNGVIAGVQALFDKSTILANNTFDYETLSPMYQTYTVNATDYFLLTAYFVNPQIICTTGRTDDDLLINGTGTGLWVQDGSTSADAVEVPNLRSDAIAQNWTENNCFVGMGSHNFYRVEEYDTVSCTVMRPIFGLYNRAGEMLGFGFIVPGTVLNPRFENPPLLAIQAILGDTPECIVNISNTVGLTSMHVYFVDTPWFIIC